jgi:hypothetical protein
VHDQSRFTEQLYGVYGVRRKLLVPRPRFLVIANNPDLKLETRNMLIP